MTNRTALDRVLHFFENVSLQSVKDIAELYDADAYFKDPFNEVRGQANIIHIFEHMFKQVDAPRFIIKQSILQDADAFIVWNFEFKMRGTKQLQTIHGSSHVRFNTAGKVAYHRDYWDAAEELYEKIPVLGNLMRFIKRKARG
ncbi:MAG: nuclear transport factor 2 family protein [Sideroxydans sp.]|nr:nuclear transport factor 2 family protein [Sideroxydans sp.]